MLVFFPVISEYDYVAVGDAPNDKVKLTFIPYLGSQGYYTYRFEAIINDVRTTTLKAISLDVFKGIVEKFKATH